MASNRARPARGARPCGAAVPSRVPPRRHVCALAAIAALGVAGCGARAPSARGGADGDDYARSADEADNRRLALREALTMDVPEALEAPPNEPLRVRVWIEETGALAPESRVIAGEHVSTPGRPGVFRAYERAGRVLPRGAELPIELSPSLQVRPRSLDVYVLEGAWREDARARVFVVTALLPIVESPVPAE